MLKYLCVIQVRMDSVRLPGKALFKVGGVTVLEYIIKRVKLAKKIDKIIVATSQSRSNDKIAKICAKAGVECFRGSEEDVLDRYYQCAINNPQYAYIIRLTADNPLVDPAVIDQVIDFSKNHPEYDFIYNGLKKTFPCGLDVQIFKRQALIEAAEKSRSRFAREGVDVYILHEKRFKKANFSAPYDWSHFRLTMDYQEDFEVIKFLIENSKITDGYLHYISVLTKHPEVMFKNINYNPKYHKKFNFIEGGSQKAIVVLGGALVEDKPSHWRTPIYEAGDNFGICGSRLRVIAAGYLYKNKPGQAVIVSGGKGQLKEVLPGKTTLASVITGELVTVGIPAKNIIKEEKSGNTYQQLKELQKIIKARDFKNIIIISNNYHLPRLRAMINYANDLRTLKEMLDSAKLKIKSAEEAVMKYQPKTWRKLISRVYKNRAMKIRIKLENQGAEQIKRGVYQFK